MKKMALLAVSTVFFGNVHALLIGNPPVNSSISPDVFRGGTNHHKEPCVIASSHCLANHMMYLQCGAILVEKMALEEGDVPEWIAYSMHSGPKVPFMLAGYEILLSFDPDLPANWYSGEELDPRVKIPNLDETDAVLEPYSLGRVNDQLDRFIQRTVDWLDSRNGTLVDACELRAYWNELRSNPMR